MPLVRLRETIRLLNIRQNMVRLNHLPLDTSLMPYLLYADITTALLKWYEEGRVPEKLIAASYNADLSANGVNFTRPLCVVSISSWIALHEF